MGPFERENVCSRMGYGRRMGRITRYLSRHLLRSRQRGVRSAPLPLQGRTEVAQRPAPHFVLRHDHGQRPPGRGRVLVVPQMHQFVGDHVVHRRERCLDDAPVQPHRPVSRAASPALLQCAAAPASGPRETLLGSRSCGAGRRIARATYPTSPFERIGSFPRIGLPIVPEKWPGAPSLKRRSATLTLSERGSRSARLRNAEEAQGALHARLPPGV